MTERISAALLCLIFIAAPSPRGLAQARAVAPAPIPSPQKDVLVFMNGDQLSGKFLGSEAGNVKFKSDMAGEITVAWDKIKDLHTSGRYAVLEMGFKSKRSRKLDQSKIAEGTLSAVDQTVSVQSDAGHVVTVPTASAEYVLDIATYDQDLRGNHGFRQGWNGGVTAGATLVYATQNSKTFSGAVNLVKLDPGVKWLDPHSRTAIDFEGSYGKVSQGGQPDIKTAIYHADAERDLYFSPRAYALVSAAFDHNFSQGLDLQQIYGGGVGLTPIKRANDQLDIKAQAQYEMQSFLVITGAPPPVKPDTHLFGATFAENYTRKFKTIALNEQVELIPAFNVLEDYSATAQVGAVFPVYKRLNFSATAVENFLNDPAPDAKKNSFQFVTGITYALK